MPEPCNYAFLDRKELSEIINELVGLIYLAQELETLIEAEKLSGEQVKASLLKCILRLLYSVEKYELYGPYTQYYVTGSANTVQRYPFIPRIELLCNWLQRFTPIQKK